ncbi:hypothetical protein NMG60_11024366 [Bertholletia excelsa]
MDYRGIQAENTNAIVWTNWLQTAAKMRSLLEVLVGIAILSWSWTQLPLAVKLSCDCLMQLSKYLFNPHINFLIGNALVIVLVLLSRQHKVGSDARTEDIFDGHSRISEVHRRIASVSDGEAATHAPAETKYYDKQSHLSDNAIAQMQCDAVSRAIEEATKEIELLQGTHPEKLKRDLQDESGRDLQRSETDSLTVERMSSEQFRRKIEAFIAKHKRSLCTQEKEDNDH